MSFNVLDAVNTGASWTVDIRKNGQVYKSYSGSGSQILSWDGLFDSAAVPEGKYNIVLKNAKQPGKERERDVETRTSLGQRNQVNHIKKNQAPAPDAINAPRCFKAVST